ncbi:MAG: hypothetical protein AAGJ93_11890 [Bacteroidota bacterium]
MKKPNVKKDLKNIKNIKVLNPDQMLIVKGGSSTIIGVEDVILH